MDKKSFFGGLATGFAVFVLGMGVYNFSPSVYGLFNKTLSADKKIDYIMNLLDEYYVDNLDYGKMEEGMYSGIVASLGDPYTTYMDAEKYKAYTDDTMGSFYGIGVSISVNPTDNTIMVIAPIPNTPAAEAGILPNDRIVKINENDVSGSDLDKAVSMMKGLEGTTVKVSVYRPSEGKTLDFDITRKKIEVSTVAHEMLEDQIGYLQITQFNKNTYDQFMEAYNDLNSKGQKALILDLRNNPGGMVDTVEKITDVLVPEGTMVYTVDKNGNREDAVSDSNRINIPLYVLVNENSASASEILSGAVQDMGVGKLVGTKTFGKGVVQGLFKLPDSSGVKITIQKYYTPKGVCIQGIGITPDYTVELPESQQNKLTVDRDLDTQLQKAIELSKESMN